MIVQLINRFTYVTICCFRILYVIKLLLSKVGVHIADVSHFIRPGTAIDREAAKRGTTVYLTDKRIDMVPELLSSNLCSLRGNEERCCANFLYCNTFNVKCVAIWLILSPASLIEKQCVVYALLKQTVLLKDPKNIFNVLTSD